MAAISCLMVVSVEMSGIPEGLVREAVAFQVLPAALDVVEFDGVFGQPFRCKPVIALGERRQGRFAPVHRPVVENDPHRPAALSRLRPVKAIEPVEQGDDVGAALASRGLDDEVLGGACASPSCPRIG